MKQILSFDTIMEEYENDVLYRIPIDLRSACDMVDDEQRFLSGLLRFHKPKNIIEIGVSAGGGSLIILNAINDNPNARLTSIDIAHNLYYDDTFTTGHVVKKHYNPDDVDSKWRLITGKDPIEVMDSLDALFDFCIIDTAHIHPVESLNFLTVLPYLADGTIVVLHDIAAYTATNKTVPRIEEFFAPKLLFDSVVADKLIPAKMYFTDGLGITSPNIAAFQITDDTRKYIMNVFSMLSFQWGYSPEKIGFFYDYFSKHYDSDCVYHFKRALRINMPNQYFESCWKRDINECKVIFYGAGFMCKALLEIFKENGYRQPYEIWDANAEMLDDIETIPVVLPRFDSLGNLDDSTIVVVTIFDKEISYSLRKEFQKAGFSNVYFWNEI